ncbi:Hypothetical protein POVR1_LOCUS162 [uncultured virus]|nr:Hypothetical protein POVR1_LOCUS162 [uncultured virus]
MEKDIVKEIDKYLVGPDLPVILYSIFYKEISESTRKGHNIHIHHDMFASLSNLLLWLKDPIKWINSHHDIVRGRTYYGDELARHHDRQIMPFCCCPTKQSWSMYHNYCTIENWKRIYLVGKLHPGMH